MTATPPATARAWHLVSRPHGWPDAGDFALRDIPVQPPGPGELLVRNLVMSVDPAMRGRMNDTRSYAPPFRLGEPMYGGAVGEVVTSEDPAFSPGDHVLHQLGWREWATLPARQATRIEPLPDVPLSAHLGVLGVTGLTAYAGLLETGGLREGDRVFVSGAAGAVGSQAGQIARLKGAARVIGSAGSDEKVRVLLDEYGFDAAFNYRAAPVAEQLAEAAPDGIDLYFDNVGGDHLEAAIGALAVHGRVVACGMIAQYNATEPPAAPRNLAQIVGKRLRIEGMLVLDHLALRPAFTEEVGGWLRAGRLVNRETRVDGIERAVDAFLGMLRGENIGKMVVGLG